MMKMIENKYIVLLRHPAGFPLLLVDDNDIAIMFDSEKEANKTAKENAFAEAFGYEVVEW